ncbi:RICIN domain-containing protein [Streptomyces sp. NPDC006235]|uniref:RICIN domain-containing protein n=1 Tax=Streptomyces sp. NPDC006235 TaxID=3156736 RepID=UPI0033BE8BCC
MGRERPLPQEARSAAEFVACMRRLKEQAGLTYRQLEASAERRGDVLARSTVADALRRDSLPRAAVVAAFVRACGRGEDTDTWLEARDRLAAAEPPPRAEDGPRPEGEGPRPAGEGSKPDSEGPTPADEGPEPEGPPEHSALSTAEILAANPSPAPVAGPVRSRRTLAATATAGLLLAAVGAWALLPGEEGGRDAAARGAGVAAGLASSSASTLTTGIDSPEPGRSRIRPALGPKEPKGNGYRIHVVHNGMCLGVNGADDRAAGAEIAQQRCTGSRDQEFLVDPVG